MRGLPGTDRTQTSLCVCIRPKDLSCCLDYNMCTTSACDALPAPRHQSLDMHVKSTKESLWLVTKLENKGL